jgi:hypothetical protein
MRQSIGFVMVAVALAGAGCSASTGSTTPVSTGTVHPAATVTVSRLPTPSPRPSPTLTREALGVDDSEATVVTHVRRQIVVALGAGWVRPRVTDNRILRLVSITGGYPSSAPLQATYVMVTPGRAQIITNTVSMEAETTWQVRVIVRQ